MLDHVLLAADHHAVAALQAPYAAACAHVHVVDPFGCQFLGAPDVVDVVGIAAVDEDVARIEVRQQVGDGLVHHCRRAPSARPPAASRASSRDPASDAAPHGVLVDQFIHRLGDLSKTTHSWPPLISRRTMLAPILPSPIIPSCINSPLIVRNFLALALSCLALRTRHSASDAHEIRLSANC